MKHLLIFVVTATLFVGSGASHAQLFGGKKSTPESQRAGADKDRITVTELNELTNGYADRYMTYIVSAVQKIEQGNPNAEQRRLANQVQLVQVSSIYDIVTNADPFTQLLDLVLVVTLQSRKWIDDDDAEKVFGSRGKYLIDASRKSREDIWRIAARVMKPEQLEQLDQMIWEWHRNNRDVQVVSYVRFDDFAAARGKSMIADVQGGGGFLASVDEAKKAVDEVRLLGERAFYLGKRMPFLLNWQARAAVADVINEPGIKALQDAVPQVTASVDRITTVAEQLPQKIASERKAIFDDLAAREPFVRTTLTQTQGAIKDADRLAATTLKVTQSANTLLQTLQETNAALNTTMKTVDQLFLKPGREKPDPNAKPFDIEQYTKSAIELTSALREANQLLVGTHQLLNSQSLAKPLEATAEQGTKVIDAAFWRGALLIVLFFVMLALYRVFMVRATRPRLPA